MKGLAFMSVLVGVALLGYLITRNREPFVAEFLEQGNVRRTAETSTSSYRQETNHFQMTQPAFDRPTGVETPFRVNQFNSFQPA